jgi:hypothetical protein
MNPVMLNNYDGTFDFIITCSEEFANSLKEKGITVIADKKIIYEF